MEPGTLLPSTSGCLSHPGQRSAPQNALAPPTMSLQTYPLSTLNNYFHQPSPFIHHDHNNVHTFTPVSLNFDMHTFAPVSSTFMIQMFHLPQLLKLMFPLFNAHHSRHTIHTITTIPSTRNLKNQINHIFHSPVNNQQDNFLDYA